jgi:MoaA/NifB/PqqE/SkfB family radical SAM enzyme
MRLQAVAPVRWQSFEKRCRARVRAWAVSAGAQRVRAVLRRAALRTELALRHVRHAASTRVDTRWAGHALRDFVPKHGGRQAMHASFLRAARDVDARFAAWRKGDARDLEFARSVLAACAKFDDGSVMLRHTKLRSYVDVSIQIAALRLCIERLAVASDGVPGALEISTLLVEQLPDSRPALLARAELLLDDGAVDAAIVNIERALRIQAVCISAQQLLFRAYRLRKERGDTARELDAVDYDLSDKFCHAPFTYLSTAWKGDVHLCACAAWVPFPVGNILEAPSADAVWNSEEAIEVRRSVLDGDFSYCSRTLCSYISARHLPSRNEIRDPILRGYIDNHTTRLPELPRMVELNHDETCNLACPSCRTEIRTAKIEEQAALGRATDRVILPLLKSMKGGCYLCGGGEAFASRHFRAILAELNRTDYPGLDLHLISNGQLITPERWDTFPNLPEMISALSISVDAATAGTYEKLRPPGRWHNLMRNLEFISKMRRSGIIKRFWINFVVQQANYREMLAFIDLGERLGVDQIWFQKVTNYGAYDEATFARIDVTSPAHPEHEALLDILRDPRMQAPLIYKQMLMSLLPATAGTAETREFFSV